MRKGRLEAFSDGVFAVIITIMVLGLHPPAATQFAALRPLLPDFLIYALSFVFLGIYWNNHHHLLQASERVNGAILWANLHLLFWLSLVPFVTAWLGEDPTAPAPAAVYGADMLLAGVAYFILTRCLIRHHGADSALARSVGRDRKGALSIALYAAGIPLAWLHAWLACGIYVLVAVLWLLPDPRIERGLAA